MSVKLYEEDRRRIVACILACKGIPTEALERIGRPVEDMRRAAVCVNACRDIPTEELVGRRFQIDFPDPNAKVPLDTKIGRAHV